MLIGYLLTAVVARKVKKVRYKPAPSDHMLTDKPLCHIADYPISLQMIAPQINSIRNSRGELRFMHQQTKQYLWSLLPQHSRVWLYSTLYFDIIVVLLGKAGNKKEKHVSKLQPSASFIREHKCGAHRVTLARQEKSLCDETKPCYNSSVLSFTTKAKEKEKRKETNSQNAQAIEQSDL